MGALQHESASVSTAIYATPLGFALVTTMVTGSDVLELHSVHQPAEDALQYAAQPISYVYERLAQTKIGSDYALELIPASKRLITRRGVLLGFARRVR